MGGRKHPQLCCRRVSCFNNYSTIIRRTRSEYCRVIPSTIDCRLDYRRPVGSVGRVLARIRVVSCRVVSFRVVSCRVVSCRVVS